ncbi:MAG: dTMP kinase [Dehalococcoidia bacterium]|nr:MAG: dTMP kinase [Dehalococcoidia bacterium]
MSLFITFEGGEGCGKSIQAEALHERLCREGIPAILTHEPGGTTLGDEICHILKWNEDLDITPLTELLLFNASRSQLVAKVIKFNLKRGKVVICDRFTDSTIVYQGHGRGIDINVIRNINDAATQGLQPDLTILLDLPVKIGFARRNNNLQDRFEKAELTFHERVHQGYLELAAEEPERFLVVDANQGKGKITDIIWQKVNQLLQLRT